MFAWIQLQLNMTCSKKQECKMKNIHKEVKPILQLIVIVWKQKNRQQKQCYSNPFDECIFRRIIYNF